VVFVPKELKEGTLYTVKIKRGLKLKGTYLFIEPGLYIPIRTGGGEERNYEKGQFQL
jgi:hypothetical protein